MPMYQPYQNEEYPWNENRELRQENQRLREALMETQDIALMVAFVTDMRLQINPTKSVEYFNSMFPSIKRIAAELGEAGKDGE